MLDDESIARIKGNASADVKRFLGRPANFIENLTNAPFKSPLFGASITTRMVVTEISVEQKAEEPLKDEGRVICELVVEEDMINGGGNMHGGCSAFLIDVTSSLALAALSMTRTGDLCPSVSQSLNVVYHSPADLGDKIRLVNTTLTLGARALSARTEIWNVTHHRLVASGVHIKMQPSSKL